MLVRYRGEEFWVGDHHVANLRLASQTDMPFVVQTLDGEICFTTHDRRTAEVWVGVHAQELISRLRRV